MVVDVKSIKGFDGRDMFQKAIFQAPYRYKTNLVEQNRACFFYIVEGKYRTYTSNDTVQLDSKDGVVKRCGSYISQYLETADTNKCEAVAIYFYEDVLKEIYNESPAIFKGNTSKSIIQKKTSNQLIDKYFESLLFYFENPLLIDEALVTLKMKEIIMLLLKTDQHTSVLELITDLFNPEQTSFKNVVNSHLYSEITLDELAHLCCMSLSTFKREFKKVFNDSPARFIKTKKLEKAANILSVSDQSITSVAFECGFGNSTRFSIVFKEHFGVSPKNYQMNQNKKT